MIPDNLLVEVADPGLTILPSLMGRLDPRELQVIRLRFGWEDGEGKTLKQVGEVFGVTKERIRQVEGKALRKLRYYFWELVEERVQERVENGVDERIDQHIKNTVAGWKRNLIAGIESCDPRGHHPLEEAIELPTRVKHALLRGGIDTVEKAVSTPNGELESLPGMGPRSVEIVREVLG